MPKRTNEYRIRFIRRKEKKLKSLSKQEQIKLTDEILKEKWQLVDDNVGLIYDVFKVYKSHDRAFEFKDLLQHGKIALRNLIDTYNPNYKVNGKRVKFSTYARRSLSGKILNFLNRKTYGSSKKKTTPMEMISDPEEGLSGEGVLPGKIKPTGLQEELERIRESNISELISKLPPKQKIVIEEISKGNKAGKISETLKNTPEAVSQLFKRAKINIRKDKVGRDLWDRYRRAIKYRDKLFKLFGREDIEQERKIKAMLKESKHKGREEYNRWLDGMSEKKRDAYFEIRGLNSLIESYIKEIRKKIRDEWDESGATGLK